MSFDEIVAELPKLTGPELQQIAKKAEFLAGLEEGLRQIEEGKLIAHEHRSFKPRYANADADFVLLFSNLSLPK